MPDPDSEPFKQFIISFSRELEREPGRYRDRLAMERLKKKLAKRHRVGTVPSNADILCALSPELASRFRPLLLKKPSRTLSGVAPVAVMTSPANCPHGKCIFCPGGVENDSPQSYTGKEPAALRAGNHGYDPFRQVSARLGQYKATGHRADKVDLIIMGGTFPAREWDYQEGFIKGCFEAMNAFGTRKRSSGTLKAAQEKNESAKARCIGLTVETRPDWCFEPHIHQMLRLGATRVELGVQTLDDSILAQVERGHTLADSVKATGLVKDSGLKLCYHMMPGLPGSDPDHSLAELKQIFSDPGFMPDMLKIYPCLVMPGTKLHRRYLEGNYRPLGSEEAAELLAKLKAEVPPWVRIQRIQRDIPAGLIDEGVKRSDLRMLAREKMKEHGSRCRCIRCREVGQSRAKGLDPDLFTLRTRSYPASGGTELFLSFEDPGEHLAGFCRLRIPSAEAFRPEIRGKKAALLRELKVFGELESLGTRSSEGWQHKGFGKQLMEEAERLAAEDWDRKKMVVTSGVGARPYYRKLGYRRQGPYMVRRL